MDDFVKDFLGRENNDTVEYLQSIGKYDEFIAITLLKEDIETISQKLLIFALDYGALYLTKYLYEIVGVAYNINIFKNYMYVYDSEESKLSTNKQPIETDISNTTKINIFYEDSYAKKRLECVNYLMDMKRYSYCYYNKGFYYVFNKKNEISL